MKYVLLCGIICIITGKVNSQEQIIPVPFNQVQIEGGFWEDRMQTEIDVTVPFSVFQSEPAIERFRRCAAFLEGKETELPETHRFISSDLYKVMEGVAYSLLIRPDAALEKQMDSVIDLIGRSQEDDGYLYISHTCGNPDHREMGKVPYSWVVHSHELYNVGHLYEAAVAYYQATGKEDLLKIAIKSADHVNKVFFEGGDPKYNGGKPINQAPGHQEIELALCKLYRVTDNPLYLEMAKKFLEIRGVTYRPEGKGVMAPTYAQQHAPVAEQKEAVGHAVRAAYQYTAMAQVDALTGQNDYGKALLAIWDNLVTTRMHITGGLGAIEGMEGFGAPYDLPNLTTYNETCAAVANVFFNQGMYLATGEARFLDIAELSLFNNALAGINIRGDRFFYVNPLEADGVRPFNHGMGGRAEWFGCACCPPNISRMILQVPGYMYAYGKNSIYLTLYGASKTVIPLEGVNVELQEKTNYPFEGNVRLTVNPQRSHSFALHLRIPSWATQDEFVPGGLYTFTDNKKEPVRILVNRQPVDYQMDKGFAVVNRQWAPGDVVELDIPMPVRTVRCDERVVDNRGMQAVIRGPIVYCAEEIDNNGPVQRLSLAGRGNAEVARIGEGILKGLPRIVFPVTDVRQLSATDNGPVTMVPYYAWCNRGDNMTMRVWLPEKSPEGNITANKLEYKNWFDKVSVSSLKEDPLSGPEGISDGWFGESSSMWDQTRNIWISEVSDQSPSIEFSLRDPQTISSIAVYWCKDDADVQLPFSWSVEYKTDGNWNSLELYVTDSYQVAPNRFNIIHPAAPIANCQGVRIKINPENGKAVAISEVRFE